MKIWKSTTVLAAAVLILGVAVILSSRPALAAHKISFDDYQDIQQLYFTYARDIDSGSTENPIGLFTPDGVFQPGTSRMSGDSLKAFYDKLRETNRTGLRHLFTNLQVVPTAEGARATCYVAIVERKGKDAPATLGTFEDQLVKTPAGWRFKQRVFTADTYEGAP